MKPNLTQKEKERIVERLDKIIFSLERTGYAVLVTFVNDSVRNIHIIIGYHVETGKIPTHRFSITFQQLDNHLNKILKNLSDYIHLLTDEQKETFFVMSSDEFIKENEIEEFKKLK